MKVVLNEKLNHLNDLKSIYSTLNKESNQQMPESISNKMENLLNKWNELEKNTDDNLNNATPSTPPPAQFETSELKEKEQKEKTETELKKEKSENFEDYFSQVVANTKSDDTKLILTSEIITSDLDEIKKSSSFIQDSSFSNVVNLIPTTTTTSTPDTPSQDNVELISNDLFDWLLWIDHTLDSQVF